MSPGEQHGGLRQFSGEDEDSREYKRWKVWVTNKLLTLGDKCPAEARGAYVYTLLSGKALECVEHCDPALYRKKNGEDVLFALLDKRFPQKDDADEMGEMLTSIFALKSLEGETLKTWISRAGELFDRCRRKTAISFPDEAQGWMILHKSGLSEEQKAVCLARAQGSLKKDDIAKAMRSCFPEFVIAKKRPQGVSLVENEVYAVESEEEPPTNNEFEDVELLLAEFEKPEVGSPSDEIFEEADVAEVMAVSWKEKRQELNKLQKSRRFKAATDLRRSFRVEVEELKKRTKCHRCQRVGHWSRECPQRPQSAKPSSSMGSSGSQHPKRSPEMGAAMVLHSVGGVYNKDSFGTADSVSLIDRMRRHVHQQQERNTSEQLLVSSPGYGVLDSGCGRTIIGSQTLSEFQQMWRDRNMKIPKPFAETNHFRFGNGQLRGSNVAKRTRFATNDKWHCCLYQIMSQVSHMSRKSRIWAASLSIYYIAWSCKRSSMMNKAIYYWRKKKFSWFFHANRNFLYSFRNFGNERI